MITNMNAYQATGKNPGRSRERLISAGTPFKTSDGYVLMAGVHSEERLRALWRLVGWEDLLEDPRYLGHGADGEFYYNRVIPAGEEWSQQRSKWEVAEKLTEIGFSMGG